MSTQEEIVTSLLSTYLTTHINLRLEFEIRVWKSKSFFEQERPTLLIDLPNTRLYTDKQEFLLRATGVFFASFTVFEFRVRILDEQVQRKV